MKCYVTKTNKAISIILLLCIIFNSFSCFAYTNIDHLEPDLQLSAHDIALKSLTEQLNSKGIGLYSITDEDIVISPSGYDFRTRVSYEINEPLYINSNNDIIATITFKLSSSSNKDISFNYKIYPGSAFLYKHYKEVENGSITFEAGETEKSIDITIYKINNNYNADNPKVFEFGELWTGDRVFYINCYGINNAMFDNERETMSIPIRLISELDLKQSYVSAKNTYMADISQIKNAESDPNIPGKYFNIGDVINIATASAITADVRKMIDVGTFSHLNLPTGYFLNEEDALGEVILQIEKNYTSFSDNALNKSTSIDGEITDFGFNDVLLSDLGIGRYFEANGAVKSLDISLNYFIDNGNVYTLFHDEYGNYVQNQMNFEDKIKPFPLDITAPSGEFCLGESIPITVTFNEAVLTDDISLKANGTVLYPVERDGTISEDVTFLYEIGADFNNLIDIQEITGAIDISGNEQDENITYSNQFSNVKLKSYTKEELFSYCTETEVFVSQGKSMNAEVYINLSLKANEELSEYLTSHKEDGRIKTVIAKVIGEDENATEVDLYANDGLLITELRGKFIAPASSVLSDKNYVAEIYFDEKETDNFDLLYSLSKQYTLPQIIYIDDESDLEILYENWPVENKISSSRVDLISLGYNVKNNATWQEPEDFVWESSNNTIASITSSGTISLTGKTGSVRFSLTALNSGQQEERFTIYSNTLQVIDSNDVFLNINGWSKNVEIIKGNDAKVYYSTNLPSNNETATTFFYNLYEAKYEADEIIKGALVVSDTRIVTAETQELYYAVDRQYLTNVSERGKYSYILELSARDLKTNMILTSSAYIRVKGLPAKAVLSKPDSYYITDETNTINVKFDVDNYTPDTEVMFTVIKNGDTIITKNSLSDKTKVIPVNIDDVPISSLYDTYMVSLKVKNECDEAYSYDSYIMYVYNSDALKISINGVNKESHTMNMDDELKNMTSEEILNLNRNIVLMDDININTEYKWSRLFDKTTWSVMDDNILSFKYKNGGILSNVDGNTLVAPDAQLLLEGLSAGKSSITVRHNLTGMEEEIEVTVDNLKEKLFIFQVYPAQKSKVIYTNGDSRYKEVETDKDGRIAIFEVSGIKGDIVFKPENSTTYDTFILSNIELKSMQQSSNNSGLYPQNNIVFKKSNYETSFYVWRVDSKGRSSLHEGDVTIKGGVYRNGVYCPNATINGKTGKEEQIVSKTGLEYVLRFDQEQFINDKYDGPITPEDKIEYIFEVSIPGDLYYSKFIKVDNETIQFYKKYYDSPVPAGTVFLESKEKSRIESNISIASQKLILGENVLDIPENIIIEDLSKSAYIKTDMAFKGNPSSNYNVKFLDKKNNVFVDSLNTEVESYDFSDTVLIKNTFDVQQYVSNLKLGEVSNLSIQITVEDAAGLEIINLPSKYNVSRINGVREISSLETGGLNKIRQDVKNSIIGSSLIDSDGKDDYIKTALNYLSRFSVDSDKLRLEITPTDNPLIFKGVIMMGVGQISKYMKSGVYSSDEKASLLYDYMPTYETYNSDFIGNSKIFMDAYMSGYGSNSKTYGGGAYFDCEIFYDIGDGEWKIVVLKSFLHIGGGYHYQKIYNTWIGPVPVTAEFLAGGTGQLNLKTLSDGGDSGSTYITEFQPYIYIRGFGGVGRDYKIVSLKAGVYGEVSLDQQYLWLKSKQKNSNGQRITLAGETGIEYEIKLVFANVEGKYAIGEGSKTWTFNDYNYIKKQYESMRLRSAEFNSNEVDDTQVTFEDRSYLANERYWNSYMARKSSASGTNIIHTNAYPYSNPVLSTDGDMMVYISDMDSYDINETSVCFSVKSGGIYPEGTAIDDSDYADTDAVIDGTADSADVAWTRVITDMEFGEGNEATAEDIQNMISGTEIMASIYNGSKFVTTRLTDNFTADMSPVVATNGEKTIVAWRSFQAGDIESPLTFDGRDTIMYRIYDGSKWSVEKCLYDGSIDKVNTLNVKMLSDGSSAITYEVSIGDTDNTEINCVIINKDGDITKNIRLTNNQQRDENPQITSVMFPDDTERFVIGWNSLMEDETEDIRVKSLIRVVAIDGNGNIYPNFETEIEGFDSVNYSNFKFTKGSEKLQNLSIAWVQPEYDSEDNYTHSLWGRKFLIQGDEIIISPEIKFLNLDNNNLIDFYDVHTDNTEKIRFMLQTTDYNTEKEYSNIIYGQSEYENKLSIEQVYYSRDELLPGNEMPFTFRLYNRGIEPVNNVSITFGGTVHKFRSDDYIMPGQYKDFNIFYTVPEIIVDPEYTITAEYSLSLYVDNVTGTIKLDVPDVGIYDIDVIKESERERLFSITLNNSTFSKLKEGKHTVKLYAYDRPDFGATPIATETISDGVSLNIINNGIFSKNMFLNEESLQVILNENGEIPDEGAQLFFKVAIEEDGKEIEDSNLSNDWDYAKIRGLISKNKESVSLTSRMKSQSGQTSVQVELTNNSMNDLIGGNIVVNLKNESGKIIQTKQFGDRTSLIVGGEETFRTTFDFNIEGTSFDAIYIWESPDGGKDDSDKPKNDVRPNDDKPKDYIIHFRDVKNTDWFYDAVRFVLENGIMVGTGTDTFEPESLVTRGMLVTILHRLENQPSALNGNFTDVMPDDYYYNAVAWAQQNAIILGIDETKFGPNESLTREQFATILYRYYLYKNNGTVGIGADLSGFEDVFMISEYALPALQWAVGEGLIKGRGEIALAPKGNTTRAETAIILQRFIERNR